MDLTALKDMPNLSRVAITEYDFTEEEMDHVLSALPYCEIDMIAIGPREPVAEAELQPEPQES